MRLTFAFSLLLLNILVATAQIPNVKGRVLHGKEPVEGAIVTLNFVDKEIKVLRVCLKIFAIKY